MSITANDLITLTQTQKNKMIYKMCNVVKNTFNFIDYIKQSSFCKQLLTNYTFTTVNHFRDYVVEKISDDFVNYVIQNGYKCNSAEQKDIKFTIVGLIGELFNIYYLENLSVYKDPNTGIVKRFNCVLPFNIVTNQSDWGADLICLNQNNELCAVQVKFYSSWSIQQGNKIELKKHCFGLLLEMMRNFNVPLSYCDQDHTFITILGDKTADVSLSLQNSPYKNCFTFIDKNDYFKALAGNTTVFTNFYNFLTNL